MNFLDFFWMKGKPGITFAVEFGAAASFYILYLLFRKYKEPVIQVEEIKVKTWFPTVLLSLMMLTLAGSSFVKDKPQYTIAGICIIYGIIGLIWHEVKHKESLSLMKDLDWHTFFFLIGIFVLVGSLTYRGIVDDIANIIIRYTNKNSFLAFTIIIWLSVALSAFIDTLYGSHDTCGEACGRFPGHRSGTIFIRTFDRDLAWRQHYSYRRLRQCCCGRAVAQEGIPCLFRRFC